MPGALSARAAYRRWYAAAGPWAGFFRAVPLVALARGSPDLFPGLRRPGGRNARAPGQATAVYPTAPTAALGLDAGATDSLVEMIRQAGTQEGWLGRPDVLLVLDLPGATSVAAVAGLARWGVRPVLLNLLWPEPGALLAAEPVLAALLRHAPRSPRANARRAAGAQYALALGRERTAPASAADLALRFDNRYSLGIIDLPSAAQLQAGGVVAVVACRLADTPPADDLTYYLDALEAGGVPVRRLALG